MNRMLPLLLTLTIICADVSFGQDDAAANDAEAQAAAKLLQRQLREDGIMVDLKLQHRVFVSRKWNGSLENLRRLSEQAPAGRFMTARNAQLNDEAISILFPNSRFEKAGISESPVTDEGLRVIAQSQTIQSLTIENSNITDRGVQSLHQMRQLKSVNIWNSKATANAIYALRAALPNCEVLADVIPIESANLSNELRVAALSVLLQKAEGKEEKDLLWRGLYNPHSEVGKLQQRELQQMRKLHPQFIKVLGVRKGKFHAEDKTPPDLIDQITTRVRAIDRDDPRLTPVARYLIHRQETGRLKKRPKSVALLAHYLDALVRSEA